MDLKRVSKFLSLVLRHKPEEIGITLDKSGWADVRELLVKMAEHKYSITMTQLVEIVRTNDKQRFAFDQYKTKIRANQGHSISDIDLGFEEMVPPEVLYHGTSTKAIDEIMKSGGLVKGKRQYVHLSSNALLAKRVGSRHGKPVIIEINARQLHDDGMKFFFSLNEVWMVYKVPKKYFRNVNYL